MSNFSPTWFAIFGAACFGIVFTVLGIIVLVLTMRNRRKSQSSLAWPTVNGIIIRSQVISSSTIDTDGYSTYTYQPDIAYEYTVIGQTYQSKKISYDTISSGSQKDAEKVSAKYQVGESVVVTYDPQNPQESILEPRVASITGGIIFAVIFIVMGLFAFVLVPVFLYKLLNLRLF